MCGEGQSLGNAVGTTKELSVRVLSTGVACSSHAVGPLLVAIRGTPAELAFTIRPCWVCQPRLR